MNVLLVRHGETPWNREGRYQGRTDMTLSVEGRAQVQRLGSTARRRDDRTRDRVAAVRALGQPRRRSSEHRLELDAGLLEISHGAWEGQLASDVERSHAEMFGVWRTAPGRDAPAGPGAETLGDVDARAWPVLARLCERLGRRRDRA